MRTAHCIACNKPLVNRRPQTKTCNAACRAQLWRKSRITMLPVTIMLSLTNFALVTKAASAAGIPINQYAHDRLVKTVETSQW